jgi:hypothetical protein
MLLKINRISFFQILFASPLLRAQPGVSGKLNQIESGALPPGSVVTFTKPEIDDYIRQELRRKPVQGLRSPTLALGAGRISGSARVDFSLLQAHTTGRPPGMLSRLLLSGERDIEADVRISSAPRYCRADILSVTVDGFDISGRALDWMLENYIRVRYPDVKIGEWFALRDNIERIDVSPHDVRVTIRA